MEVVKVTEIGLKRPVILPLAIREHGLILKGEADIGFIPDTITPITKVKVLYC